MSIQYEAAGGGALGIVNNAVLKEMTRIASSYFGGSEEKISEVAPVSYLARKELCSSQFCISTMCAKVKTVLKDRRASYFIRNLSKCLKFWKRQEHFSGQQQRD